MGVALLVQQVAQGGEEGFALAVGAEDEQFLELVEEEVDRFEMIQVEIGGELAKVGGAAGG